MRAVIFANGVLTNPLKAHSFLQPGDILIAADGGARHCAALGLKPHAVIGDFDSLGSSEITALKDGGSRLVQFPTRKDFTDLELAIQYANELGVEEALVLGALGSRWDQTLANLLLPATSAFSKLRIRIVDENQEITLIQSGQMLTLSGEPGDTVSLVPIGGDASGVTTHGLEYPLDQETLFFGATRGISNVLKEEHAEIQLKNGFLLCILIRRESKNG
jgi:thiamine pyrophosphokinase